MASRWKAWATTSPSCLPSCRARAEASFLTWFTATSCQPPNDSTAMGKKEIPCARQSSAALLIFLSKAWLRAKPGLAAAPATKSACSQTFVQLNSQTVKQLNSQTNVCPVKIARFGVQWLKFLSRSKVKRDSSVPIVNLLNILVFCRASVTLDMTAGKLRWAELWSYCQQVCFICTSGKICHRTLCRFWSKTTHFPSTLISRTPNSIRWANVSIYAKNMFYHWYFDHFLISACADPLENRLK